MAKQKIDYREGVRIVDALSWFGKVQLTRLLENIYKEGWVSCPDTYLLSKLDKKVEELKEVVCSGNHPEIIRKCADVANYGLIIADKYKQSGG